MKLWKKSILLVLSIFFIFALCACDKNGDGDLESPSDYSDDNSVTVTDFGFYKMETVSTLRPRPISELKHVEGTKEYTLPGLCANKAITVGIKITTKNESTEEKTLNYRITVNNVVGYKLSDNSNKYNVMIRTINEDTSSPKIEVSDIAVVAAAGKEETHRFQFEYECINKDKDTLEPQDWTLSSDSGKQIDKLVLNLTEINLGRKMQEPKVKCDDGKIIVIPTEETNGVFGFVNGDVENPRSFIEEDGQYSLSVDKSGEYTIKILSTELRIEDYDCSVSCKLLESPVVGFTKEGDSVMLEWNSVANAESYDIYNADTGELIGNTEQTSFDVYKYINGESLFIVKAHADKDFVFNSVESNEVTLRKLAVPTIVLKLGKIEWNAVNGAEKYGIYVDGVLSATTDDNSFRINENYRDKKICVRALAPEDGNFVSSEFSNTVKGDVN